MIRMPRALAIALAAGTAAITLAACDVPTEPRGNQPQADVLDQIKPGSSDKEMVTRLLGSPSSISTFDNNTWYYISQKMKELAFFKPEAVDEQVITIAFDKDGVVKDVQKAGLDARHDVDPAPGKTPAPGRELSFIEQLIGNFGKFNSADKDKNSGP